jgi:hypothetical protein
MNGYVENITREEGFGKWTEGKYRDKVCGEMRRGFIFYAD